MIKEDNRIINNKNNMSMIEFMQNNKNDNSCIMEDIDEKNNNNRFKSIKQESSLDKMKELAHSLGEYTITIDLGGMLA